MSTCLIMFIALTFDGGCPSSWTPSNTARFTQSIGNHLLCWHVYTFLHIGFDLQLIVCVKHMGHPRYPFVTRPTVVPYARRSWIVHINIVHILNSIWPLNVAASCTCTPISHNSFNSSTNNYK
jgi:hypothetical protein